MNKILLVGDKIANSYLEIKEDTVLTWQIDDDMVINCLDNTSLNIEKLSYLNKDLKLDFKLNNNNTLNLNYLIINHGCNKVTIDIEMLKNSSKANIIIRVVNATKDSKIILDVNGIISANTLNNELIQDIKGLILSTDTIKVNPNIYAYTNEVIANHLVTISSFNKEELFYLETKGFTQKEAKNILLASFLKSNISYFKDKIQMEVINIE